ncbi:MAG: glutathione synthase [Magnetospiraceae bacterium]
MTLSVALQMDPVETIDINGDSSFVLGLEALKRGYRLYHYLPRDLAFHRNRVMAYVRPLTLRREHGNHHSLGDPSWMDLAELDVVLMRQDPPFDMSYITATHLLEHVHPETLVVNDPVNVRNAPEKLLVTHFPDLLPPTLIANRRDLVEEFRAEHQDIIVKPLFGNGGAGVFHLPPGDENLNSLLELFGGIFREPVIVQRYLPEVRKGDKRIILVNGKPAGAVNRIPAQGEARSNMHVGGQAVATELTTREQEICEAIGPTLKEQGLIFVGIDVIGDYLTEINVTSPTGIQEINRFNGSALEADIWDAIEARL